METSAVKQYFEEIRSYVSAMRMRVDDENVVKARNLIAYLNERIIECNAEMAKEAQKEAEETNKETEA